MTHAREHSDHPTAELGELTAPGAVLLVSCYELGHQPLALALAHAFLTRAGFAPDCLDVAVDGLDSDKLSRARVVVIAVPMHTALRLGVRVAQRVRSVRPQALVCFAGLYALLNAHHLLENHADWIIGGEWEMPLVTKLRALATGDSRPVDGVGDRATRARAYLSRLDFPVPDRRSLPPLSRYAMLDDGGILSPAGYVEASRGCLHTCRHCPIPPVYGGRFFVVPREVVMADVRHLIQAGARHITLGDPDFLNGPGHAMAVARAVAREVPHVTFDFTAKVEHLLRHRRLLPELAALGARFLVSAFESFDDTVLRHLDKGHTRADSLAAIRITRESGIALRPTFVPFTPWETLEGFLDIMATVAHEGLALSVDPVQFTMRLLIPPGSLLATLPAMAPHLCKLDAAAFGYTWKHPDPRMDRLQGEAAALVARAAGNHEAPGRTFARLWALAAEIAGIGGTQGSVAPEVPSGSPAPRLTESWFC